MDNENEEGETKLELLGWNGAERNASGGLIERVICPRAAE